MKLICQGHPFRYEMSCLLMLFFPGERIVDSEDCPPGEEWVLTALEVGEAVSLAVGARLGGQVLEERATLPLSTTPQERERGLAVAGYRLLSQMTGKAPKWGILTGVRPVKLLERSLEGGMTKEEAERLFREEYLVSAEKLRLAMATQEMEHKILGRSTPESYSLYISIPFCPSRCLYCSFVSHSIEKTQKLIDPYVNRLCEEIAHTARVAEELGLRLRTVYFGGGTPTAITAEQLKRLTDAVAASFDLSDIWEYTIEAGRPDTITREKLQVIKDAGVTRISINPQTLEDGVLEFVGRKHTAAETAEAFRLAREVGFTNINMDLIAGLPTDSPAGFRRTMAGILELGPENVTVHTLSVKRAADLTGAENLDLAAQAAGVGEMVDFAQETLMANGYGPYYLYRQKNMLDNLENTGYCKPGTEGLYNVYIMDETHTILACGAGAVTKLRQPDGPEIERIFNFKYPYEYLDRFGTILERKEQVKDFYERYPLPQKGN